MYTAQLIHSTNIKTYKSSSQCTALLSNLHEVDHKRGYQNFKKSFHR